MGWASVKPAGVGAQEARHEASGVEIERADLDYSVGSVPVDLVDHSFTGAGPVHQFPVGIALA